MSKLHNYTETLVNEVLNEILPGRNDVCKCEKCRLDIMAKALNNLPPHYYVSDKGQVFSKIFGSFLNSRTQVVTEVTKAIMQVAQNPLHEELDTIEG